MGLKLDSKKAFEDYINQQKEVTLKKYIISELTNFGNEFIKARLNTENTFTNRTTRLRNSIGYVISYNGKIEKTDFETYSIGGIADEEGRTLGRNYATSIADNIQGYALVCVAGADYAFYVEAKGHDVITGSVLTLKQNLGKWSV